MDMEAAIECVDDLIVTRGGPETQTAWATVLEGMEQLAVRLVVAERLLATPRAPFAFSGTTSRSETSAEKLDPEAW
jgi:hypothetical protein